MQRRNLLVNTGLYGLGLTLATPAIVGTAHSLEQRQPLQIPKQLYLNSSATKSLRAVSGFHQFGNGIRSPSIGYNQSYLGPTLRVRRGETARVSVENSLTTSMTAHWHGLHVDGKNDGGPHSPIPPGGSFQAELDIDQPAATLWYHSHIHQQTGEQVYAGLAGMMIIDDPQFGNSGLPNTYGADDIPLIIQDKMFDRQGWQTYDLNMPTRMHGFKADKIVVNGSINPAASVARGIVRLRLLNAANARIFNFSFEDGRPFYQVASDAGLLPVPVPMNSVRLAPAERIEVLVDFSDGAPVRLLSEPDANGFMGGMMGGGMRGGGMGRGGMGNGGRGGSFGNDSPQLIDGARFEVMTFIVDGALPASHANMPTQISGAPSVPSTGTPTRYRDFSLDMGMGSLGINGRSISMRRIDEAVRLNDTEIWRVRSNEMAHPFHVHGTSFQVLKLNEQNQDFRKTGLKDVVLVNGTAELLVNFRKRADERTPYMYHCHILEHEDNGMMGQFTVT